MDRLTLELHPEHGRAIFSKIAKLVLGVFLFVFPATGLSIYFLLDSPYLVYVAAGVNALSFVIVIYWVINSTRSVCQVEISTTGFTMYSPRNSPTANGRHKWQDIAYYTFKTGDENSKSTLSLYFDTGKRLSFYYLGFKEFGDLGNFYQILRSHMPDKERAA